MFTAGCSKQRDMRTESWREYKHAGPYWPMIRISDLILKVIELIEKVEQGVNMI